LVGGGPYLNNLRTRAVRTGLTDHVVLTGPVDFDQLPAHFAAGDVFAMPCRTRRLGMDVEGLGIVFLEASATGLPVVAGDSGGAPDAVQEGRTGFVVDGTNAVAVTDRIAELLSDRVLAGQFGAAGRKWVEQNWQWDALAERLAGLLRP
jgi:phosphatidylinositol alpha-1,6-mannosyltransferase